MLLTCRPCFDYSSCVERGRFYICLTPPKISPIHKQQKTMPYILIIFAYLVGSIPCGLLLGRTKGVDVRQNGSGNIGATNVSRQLGKALGLLTLIGDALKALLPMILASWILKNHETREAIVLFCGGAAFLGHLFPIYLKFKGGKGVATALGVFLYLNPLALAASLACFIGVVFFLGYVSVGSLTAAVLMPVFLWMFGGAPNQVLLAVFISALIWIKHRDNIVRLIKHKEKSWKKNSPPPPR